MTIIQRAIVVILGLTVLVGVVVLTLERSQPLKTERSLVKSSPQYVPANAPRIAFEKRVVDFGPVRPVPKLEGAFIIRNDGKSLLEIQTPSADCGCTLASLGASRLAPGEQTTLPFTLDLRGMSGAQARQITVSSNDPLNPHVTLDIKVDVQRLFSIEPTPLTFGELHVTEDTNLTAVVTRLDGHALNITNIVTSSGMTASVGAPMDGDPTRVPITLTVEGRNGARQVYDVFGVFTDDGDLLQPVLSSSVSGRVLDWVYTTPERIFWGVPYNAKWEDVTNLHARTFQVEAYRDDKPLKILGVKANITGFEYLWKTLDNGKLEVTVRLVTPPKQAAHGTIQITTDHPLKPIVEVPFNINVPQPPPGWN